VPGVEGLEVDEVFLRDDEDDGDERGGIRRGYQAEGGGEDSSYKSTSPSLSRFGGSTGNGSSSVESSQTRNSPPPPHFEKTYSYPSSRNFGAGPGAAGSIRQRRSSSRLYSDYHGFVEEYDYDYDHLTPPCMGGMGGMGGEARIWNIDDSDTPSPPPIRLTTFPASQAPNKVHPPPGLRQWTSSRALAQKGAREERMKMGNGLLDMSGKVVSLVGLLVLFWVILS
jgi:hypothetical protein